MDGIKEMAKMMKDRENQTKLGIGTGTVISTSPLTINFQSLTLSNKNLVTAIPLNNLQIKDRLIIIPSEDVQTFFIIGKEA